MNRAAQFDFLSLCLRTAAAESEAGRTAMSCGLEFADDCWPDLVTLASEQLVTPALFPAWGRWGVLDALPGDVRDYFEAVFLLNGDRNERIAAQAREIAGALDGAGIEPVFLKGTAHLLSGLYASPASRFVRDIDLLVAGSEIEPAAAALRQIGYAAAPAVHDRPEPDHHLPPLIHPEREVCVEIHRRLTSGRKEWLPSADVLQDAEPLPAGKLRLRIPSLPHRVLHHVLHTQVHHGHFTTRRVSLQRLLDWGPLVEQLAARGQWPAVCEHFQRLDRPDILAGYARLGQQILGVDVPPELGDAVAARRAFRQFRLWQRFPALTRAAIGIRHAAWMAAEFWHNPDYRRRWSRRLIDPRFYADVPRRLRAVFAESN